MCLMNPNSTFAEQVSVPIVPPGLFPCKVQKRQETFWNDQKRRGTECYGISV
jgi:hypothetical protein